MPIGLSFNRSMYANVGLKKNVYQLFRKTLLIPAIHWTLREGYYI